MMEVRPTKRFLNTNARQSQCKARQALSHGIISAPRLCEVCGVDPSTAPTEKWHKSNRHKRLVAHHWRGYDFPLDVWWVCYSCNTILTKRHDGLLKDVTSAFYYVFWYIPIERIPEKFKYVRNLRWLRNQR